MVKIHKRYQDYLPNPVVNTFHLDLTMTEEVQSYIINILKIRALVFQTYQTNCLNNSKYLSVNL